MRKIARAFEGRHALRRRTGDRHRSLLAPRTAEPVAARLNSLRVGRCRLCRTRYSSSAAALPRAYTTPDAKATIACAIWDATGKNLTRAQTLKIDGAIPTIVVDKEGSRRLDATVTADAMLRVE